jgi:hypothetical protein
MTMGMLASSPWKTKLGIPKRMGCGVEVVTGLGLGMDVGVEACEAAAHAVMRNGMSRIKYFMVFSFLSDGWY